ncbi:uncharacterized protein EDB91DRAFT_1255633 [Suillus paluster]|uniref:uncharacterized protein n=1 Tax=Suillus paluster TaxID=48578 RepID=UPI001B88631E|nr:uncharacterized protein EDB91DRAFT_1255633 [Suillus paluster]KAG1723484.1 hypothetical protein EDB91DRAFT_1255633 [Suillus paluster]
MTLPHNIEFKFPLKELPGMELERTHDSPNYSGGFGDVWKCSWSPSSVNLPVAVAIKVVRVADSGQTEILAKTAQGIRREAYVWVNLKDDHVLSLHGITGGFGVLPAFVSSWVTKGSLDSYYRR